MIGFLSGTLASKGAEGCFVDVGGVGYRLTCSTTTLASLPAVGAPCRLWTHLHVREDALALFGFATEGEQQMFEGLVAVSGIGPKVALGVCSSFTPDAFRSLLATEDAASIASVPGVGRKTASRILLELRDRLEALDPGAQVPGGDGLVAARSALENLGCAPVEIRAALAAVSPDHSVEEAVRAALKAIPQARAVHA